MESSSDLPTTIIIRDIPRELFEDDELKENFTSMFHDIDQEIRIEFLKSFNRVRVHFTKPEYATAGKLMVEHHSFNGAKMKAHFANRIKLSQKCYQDERGHLTLPPLEKQFLISPPSSPPVGWVQHKEMAPIICDFDLMSRLAALSVDDYEVHEGKNDDSEKHPSIVVTPCEKGNESFETNNSLTPNSPVSSRSRPRTPRPP